MSSATARCLLAAFLFGAAIPGAKALLGEIGPLTLAGLLYLGAAGAAFPHSWRDFRRSAGADLRNWLLLGAAVFFGGGLGPILLLIGLSQAPAASVSLWLNLETVATAFFAWAFFREHVAARTWSATILIVSAGILLAAPSGFALRMPALLVALACLCWGLDNNVTSLIDRFTPAQTTLAKGLIAGTLNLALGAATESFRLETPAVLSALLVGLAGYGLSLTLYISGAQQLGATRSQLIFATSPYWGTIVAWTALQEPASSVQIASGGLMLLALWVVHKESHRHVHRHETQEHTHMHRHDDGHHGHEHDDLPAPASHSHSHRHSELTHDHAHLPDLHHRHEH